MMMRAMVNGDDKYVSVGGISEDKLIMLMIMVMIMQFGHRELFLCFVIMQQYFNAFVRACQ
jgi:hypothetical protein